MPKFRFTIRRLMVAVAASALLLGVGVIGFRWDEYRRRARHHSEIAELLTSEAEALRAGGGTDADIRERDKARAEQARLAEVYRRAMRRPWLPVGGD